MGQEQLVIKIHHPLYQDISLYDFNLQNYYDFLYVDAYGFEVHEEHIVNLGTHRISANY